MKKSHISNNIFKYDSSSSFPIAYLEELLGAAVELALHALHLLLDVANLLLIPVEELVMDCIANCSDIKSLDILPPNIWSCDRPVTGYKERPDIRYMPKKNALKVCFVTHILLS